MNKMKVSLYKFIGFLFLMVLTHTSFAQAVDREIQIGDSMVIGECKPGAKNFTGIDLLTKTRWAPGSTKYNPASGIAYYDWFFNDSDFDTQRLPCSYSGKKFVIADIRQFNDKAGKLQTVFIGRFDNDKQIFFIMIDIAAPLGEVLFF